MPRRTRLRRHDSRHPRGADGPDHIVFLGGYKKNLGLSLGNPLIFLARSHCQPEAPRGEIEQLIDSFSIFSFRGFPVPGTLR